MNDSTKRKNKNSSKRLVWLSCFCLILLISLTIIASYSNMKKYYFIEKDGALEIWQGRFAPMAKKRLLTLPGIQVPAALKPVYTWDEVCPLAFQYYVNKADTISEVPGIPDFDGIKSYLNKALTFAVTPEQRNIALSRLYGIDIMILLYKADINASRGSLTDLATALSYLQKARSLDINGYHTDIINQKIEWTQSKMKDQQKQNTTP
jgi:hypothetical protein